MKLTKIKNFIALGVAAGAMFVASNSSTMCGWFGGAFEEPKMPESLYKRN